MKGLQIDHLCRNQACVNVEHLEPVTPRENHLCGEGSTAQNARKTHCKNGHEFSPENTWVNGKTQARQCRTCSRERLRARRATARGEVVMHDGYAQ